MLLVQGTGSGNSAVPQTVGVITCVITLIIDTLSLGAYQQSSGPIQSYQRDATTQTIDVNNLIEILTNME